jgi:DNA polymerase III alpha subunit
MASLRLEQPGIAVEAVMFEKNLGEGALPPSNTPVLALGTVERNFDGVGTRLNIERILPISEVRSSRIKRVNLLLRAKNKELDLDTEERIRKLAFFLKSKQGPTQVHLAVLFPDALVEFNTKDLRVDLDDHTIEELKNAHAYGLSFEMFTQPSTPVQSNQVH